MNKLFVLLTTMSLLILAGCSSTVNETSNSIIQETGKELQEKALEVGGQTQKNESINLQIFKVEVNGVSDSEVNGGVDEYAITLRSKGSTQISLSDIIIQIGKDSLIQKVSYIGSSGTATINNYNVTYSNENSTQGFINKDEYVELVFIAQYSLLEFEDATIQVLSNEVVLEDISVTLPYLIDTKATIYP